MKSENIPKTKPYRVKSPSGKVFTVIAETLYHAISIVCEEKESFTYSNIEYIKLNKRHENNT
ncbi:MAG: hypothetical protein EKK61_03930 [Rickettsiales bacterium]|nr:MAG: hypothetical protein EKK61_03930 [Rickettsiales bacterium]